MGTGWAPREKGLRGNTRNPLFFLEPSPGGEEMEVRPEPLQVEEIGQCLKRIHKSVQRWNKLRGRRGYLDFVSPFIG